MKVSSVQGSFLSLDGTLPTFGKQVTIVTFVQITPDRNTTSLKVTTSRSDVEMSEIRDRHPNAPAAQGREVAPRLTISQLR